MSNEGRCGDARALRHACGCGFEVSDRDGRSLDRWSIGMVGKGSQRCYQTLFKI